MFDTKIFHQFGCECLDRHKIDCGCEYHIGQTGFRNAYQTLIEKQIYEKGFYDGRKEAWADFEREKYLFRDMASQEKMAKLLQGAMLPLEELKKKLTL